MKGKPSFIVVVFHSTATSLEISVENTQNGKVDLPYELDIPVLDINPEDSIFYPPFTAVLLITARI